jgi:thiol-disulfide isomerase/thioredoxin
MAVSSSMLELGTPLPRFSLPDTVSGRLFDSESLLGSVAVVAFLCNHCPYVKHIQGELAAFGRHAAGLGVKMVAVSSNDPTTHPEDGPEAMAEEARRAGYAFPYLYDEAQDVAKKFRAMCTPEFYVFDRAGTLAYRGRFDGATPRNGVSPTGAELRAAVDALVRGASPSADQKPSIGCSIKWRAGNAPAY